MYGLLVEISSTPQRTLAFLTERMDPQGRETQFVYSTNNGLVRLTQVIDMDGRASEIRYSGANETKVEEIENPDGHLVQFFYNSDDLLTNIVDVAGISSSFDYTETNGVFVLNKMMTPYGETSFGYLRPTAGLYGESADDNINRAITVTQPDGGKHVFMYRDFCAYLLRDEQWLTFLPYCYEDRPDDLPVSGYCDEGNEGVVLDLCNHNVYFRNSFYWGPLQYSALSTGNITQLSTNDYHLAKMRNWLHSSHNSAEALSVSDTLNMQREPSPDGTTLGQAAWYGYAAKSWWHWEGTNARPSYIARVLPSGETQYTYREYNELGRVTLEVSSWSDGDSVGTRTNTFIYDEDGIDLVLHLGPTGEQVVSNYFSNSYHQVDASYDALNQETKYTYNGNRQLTSIQRPGGLTTLRIYDENNQLQNTIDVEISRTNTFIWYSTGNLESHTDERGLTVNYYWDALNRLTGTSYPDGTTTTNLYTVGSTKILDLTATKDRLGWWTYFGYDGLRRKVAETNANGVVTRYGYCDCGTLYSVTNAWNTSVQMVTTFGYDNQGNRLYTYLPDAMITNWFDSLRRTIATGDAWGYRYFYYNNQGLLTNVSNLHGPEQTTIFDIEDRPIYVTDANGVTITNAFDELDRLSTRTYPDGGVERFGYSARGLIAYTNQLDKITYYGYDEAMRRTWETNANNEILRYTNNAAGDLLSLTDGKNQTTKWNYDEYGRVTNKLDQASVEILRYKYDPDSRLTNRWSKAKGDTKYKYDPVGNLTNVDYAASTDVTFAYDPLNRVTSMVDAAGTTTYAYTAGGHLWTEDGPWSNDTVTNSYTYRLRTGLALQQPTGMWTNGFWYDYAKRLTNVTSPAGSFAYTLGGTVAGSPLPRKLLLPNTSYITNHYDNVARLLFTRLNNSSDSTLNKHEYVLNTGNQRTKHTRTDDSHLTFSYDPIGQLTIARATNSGGTIITGETRGYAYDAAWNLNYRTNYTTLNTFKVDPKNQLTNATPVGNQTYDGNGNVISSQGGIQTYSYDDENRLRTNELTGPYSRSVFTYDGLGRLRQREEYAFSGTPTFYWYLTATVRYVYDGMRVIQERNEVNTPQVSYTRGSDLSGSLEGAGGIGGLLARSHGYSGSTGNWSTHNFYHADGGGNITYLVTSSQGLAASYRYDPYGNTISQSGSLSSANVYRFSSKEQHANSGLYYYGYRWYAPNLQRWLNRDPIDEIGFDLLRNEGIPSVDGWNLYAFVANSPASFVDPYGLSARAAGAGARCLAKACAAALVDGPLPIGDVVALGIIVVECGVICVNMSRYESGQQNYINDIARERAKKSGRNVCTELALMMAEAYRCGDKKLQQEIKQAQKAAGCRRGNY